MTPALVLLIIFLLWARAAMLVNTFFPWEGERDLTAIVTPLPMLANRDVGVVRAVVSNLSIK